MVIGLEDTYPIGLKSYLTIGSQYVVFGANKFDVKDTTHGVPQGSSLSPLLLLLYINDLVGVYFSFTHCIVC